MEVAQRPAHCQGSVDAHGASAKGSLRHAPARSFDPTCFVLPVGLVILGAVETAASAQHRPRVSSMSQLHCVLVAPRRVDDTGNHRGATPVLLPELLAQALIAVDECILEQSRRLCRAPDSAGSHGFQLILEELGSLEGGARAAVAIQHGKDAGRCGPQRAPRLQVAEDVRILVGPPPPLHGDGGSCPLWGRAPLDDHGSHRLG
mmetsp:Transcript_63610/g.149048  ORF Transcript_63610/g.149048 Transcript_63610/m.149048 type:complete len:204 (+) Transcript_63610:778-1389(+)